MKKIKIIYWISTLLFCTFLLLTSISYFTDPKFIAVFGHLGFPQYFRIELGIAKICGVILLLVPGIPARVKEWAYAGFAITLISGTVAHANSGDPAGYVINVIFFFILLVCSYIFWHKRIKARELASNSKSF